jgi:hypothetical protein
MQCVAEDPVLQIIRSDLWEEMTLVKAGVEMREGPPVPREGMTFFTPRRGQRLYDFALVDGNTVHLFHVTMRDKHGINVPALKSVASKFGGLGNVHF